LIDETHLHNLDVSELSKEENSLAKHLKALQIESKQDPDSDILETNSDIGNFKFSPQHRSLTAPSRIWLSTNFKFRQESLELYSRECTAVRRTCSLYEIFQF